MREEDIDNGIREIDENVDVGFEFNDTIYRFIKNKDNSISWVWSGKDIEDGGASIANFYNKTEQMEFLKKVMYCLDIQELSLKPDKCPVCNKNLSDSEYNGKCFSCVYKELIKNGK